MKKTISENYKVRGGKGYSEALPPTGLKGEKRINSPNSKEAIRVREQEALFKGGHYFFRIEDGSGQNRKRSNSRDGVLREASKAGKTNLELGKKNSGKSSWKYGERLNLQRGGKKNCGPERRKRQMKRGKN